MTTKLSEDQRRALLNHPDGPISVEDDQSRKRFVLVDQGLHERAMQVLKQQEDLSAIQEGIDEMEAGRVVAFEDVDARIRAKLGLPPRS